MPELNSLFVLAFLWQYYWDPPLKKMEAFCLVWIKWHESYIVGRPASMLCWYSFHRMRDGYVDKNTHEWDDWLTDVRAYSSVGLVEDGLGLFPSLRAWVRVRRCWEEEEETRFRGDVDCRSSSSSGNSHAIVLKQLIQTMIWWWWCNLES